MVEVSYKLRDKTAYHSKGLRPDISKRYIPHHQSAWIRVRFLD